MATISTAIPSALAWTTSREAPPEITDKDYMFPSFSNGETLLDKQQGRLPAMGWNSWNPFGTGNTEELTRAQADKIVELGLDKLGYQYVVLDVGCYSDNRDSDGYLTNNQQKFQSGIQAMSDYLHDKGLKFGMYNDIGIYHCASRIIGTAGYEDLDAEKYVEWGVDYLKVDNCEYLWDNATGTGEAATKYTYAPAIRSITVSGNELQTTLNAVNDGLLTGDGARKDISGDFVNYIGTKDGMNIGVSPIGDMWSELEFTVNAPSEGQYQLTVNYASGEQTGTGRWLQIAVGDVENETRYMDELLPESGGIDVFCDSAPITVTLEEGENTIRLMNHRRQENTLNSYAALFESMKKYGGDDYDFVLSLCEWGKTQPQNWGYKVGNSWRILNDITFKVGIGGSAVWSSNNTSSITSQYNKAVIMDEFSGLDKGWNDPDMMVIGMNGITPTMGKTHMSMWCMMNAPLMLGMDLRSVEAGDDVYNIISNADVIALNQDTLGVQAKRIYSSILSSAPDTTYVQDINRVDILAKPLSNGDVALSFINVSSSSNRDTHTVSVDDIISYIGHKMVDADSFGNAQAYVLTDLWSGEKSVNTSGSFSVSEIEGCDSITVRVSPIGSEDDEKDALKAIIEAAETEIASNSEKPVSFADEILQGAVNEANSVLNSGGSCLDEAKKLQSAIEEYREVYGIYSALGTEIDTVKDMTGNSGIYNKDSAWMTFNAEYEKAHTVYNNPESFADIESAIVGLRTAAASLNYNVDAAFNPIAWYVFNDTSSDTVKDVSGYNRDAQLVNDGAKIPSIGTLSLNANGENNGYVQLPAGILSNAEEFTFSAWVNIKEHQTWGRLFDFGMSSNNGYMFLSPYSGSGVLQYAITPTSNGGEQRVVADTTIAVGEWLNITAVQSGTTLTIYVNGEPATSGTVTNTPAQCIKEAINSYIGKSQWNDRYLSGEIKDVRIYDKALSENQLYAMLNGGSTLSLTAKDSAGCTVVNETEGSMTAVLYVAEYDENGALCNVMKSTVELSNPGECGSTVIDISDMNTVGHTVKAFLWNAEDNSPITDAMSAVIKKDPVWTVKNASPDNMTVNSTTNLTIITERGDVWNTADGNGTIKNMYLMPVPQDSKDNFTAEVKIHFKPDEIYQRAALIAYAGDGNNVSVMRRYHNGMGGNAFMTTMNLNGRASDESVYTPDSHGEECLLRLEKNGSSFNAAFSVDDGATWEPLETRIQEVLAASDNLFIGLYASNGEQNATSVPVTFENFKFNGEVIEFDAE